MPSPIGVPILGPTSFTDLATTAADPVFYNRVAIAAVEFAHLVMAEDASYYTDDAARKAYAKLVISNPIAFALQEIAWSALADQATNASSDDDHLIARMNTMWSKLST